MWPFCRDIWRRTGRPACRKSLAVCGNSREFWHVAASAWQNPLTAPKGKVSGVGRSPARFVASDNRRFRSPEESSARGDARGATGTRPRRQSCQADGKRSLLQSTFVRRAFQRRFVRVCTRGPPTRSGTSEKTALESQADGGIRTLDPRSTRVIWGRERRMFEALAGSKGLQFRRFVLPTLDLSNPRVDAPMYAFCTRGRDTKQQPAAAGRALVPVVDLGRLVVAVLPLALCLRSSRARVDCCSCREQRSPPPLSIRGHVPAASV
jgi:hypothetical protein